MSAPADDLRRAADLRRAVEIFNRVASGAPAVEPPAPKPAKVVALPAVDSRCCICGNAYGTRHICESCRNDPANTDADGRFIWIEGDETSGDVDDAASTVAWGEAAPWMPTPAFSEVARRLAAGMTYRAIAAELGCAIAFAAEVAEEVGLCQRDVPTFGRHVTTLAVRGMAAAAGAARPLDATS